MQEVFFKNPATAFFHRFQVCFEKLFFAVDPSGAKPFVSSNLAVMSVVHVKAELTANFSEYRFVVQRFHPGLWSRLCFTQLKPTWLLCTGSDVQVPAALGQKLAEAFFKKRFPLFWVVVQHEARLHFCAEAKVLQRQLGMGAALPPMEVGL